MQETKNKKIYKKWSPKLHVIKDNPQEEARLKKEQLEALEEDLEDQAERSIAKQMNSISRTQFSRNP